MTSVLAGFGSVIAPPPSPPRTLPGATRRRRLPGGWHGSRDRGAGQRHQGPRRSTDRGNTPPPPDLRAADPGIQPTLRAAPTPPRGCDPPHTPPEAARRAPSLRPALPGPAARHARSVPSLPSTRGTPGELAPPRPTVIRPVPATHQRGRTPPHPPAGRSRTGPPAQLRPAAPPGGPGGGERCWEGSDPPAWPARQPSAAPDTTRPTIRADAGSPLAFS